MKTIFALLILASSLNVNCQKNFEFVSATSQSWHGGRPESGYGTKYEITLIPKKGSDIITFDRIWIGDKYFEVKAVQNGRKVKEGIFDAGYEVSIYVNDIKVPHSMGKSISIEEQNEIDKNKIPVPHKYNGEALLSYTYRGKRKYFEIEKFQHKEEDNQKQ